MITAFVIGFTTVNLAGCVLLLVYHRWQAADTARVMRDKFGNHGYTVSWTGIDGKRWKFDLDRGCTVPSDQ